jgi:hypothetical protein
MGGVRAEQVPLCLRRASAPGAATVENESTRLLVRPFHDVRSAENTSNFKPPELTYIGLAIVPRPNADECITKSRLLHHDDKIEGRGCRQRQHEQRLCADFVAYDSSEAMFFELCNSK